MTTADMVTSVTNFFKTSVIVEYDDDKGRTKHRTENYIVEAVNPGEVEKVIAKEMDGYTWRIKSISLLNIMKVL